MHGDKKEASIKYGLITDQEQYVLLPMGIAILSMVYKL